MEGSRYSEEQIIAPLAEPMPPAIFPGLPIVVSLTAHPEGRSDTVRVESEWAYRFRQ
jgi:hypothetical protein